MNADERRWELDSLTEAVLGAVFEVSNTLGGVEMRRPAAEAGQASAGHAGSPRWHRRLASGQSGGGHVAAGPVQNKARGPTVRAGFKGDLVVRYSGEEVLLAFGK